MDLFRPACLAFVMLACSKRAAPTEAPIVTSIDAASPATTVSTAPVPVDPKEAAMRQVAIDWNDALNARDYTKLGDLHAPTVKFYGRSVDRATYIANIKQAIAKDPSFHQEITGLAIASMPIRTKVSFHKKDAKHEAEGYLLIREVGPRWLIDEESDQATVDATKCVRPNGTVVVTGEVKMMSTQGHLFFTLDMPLCIAGANEQNDAMAARIDAIDEVFLGSDKEWLGKKIRVRGTIHVDYVYLGTIGIEPQEITPL